MVVLLRVTGLGWNRSLAMVTPKIYPILTRKYFLEFMGFWLRDGDT
jgi:hypothetical protein